MSTIDEKLERHRQSDGPARRTYASLAASRGFWPNPRADGIIMPENIRDDEYHCVAICPMDTRTFWRHVGGGKWNSKDALYEEVMT